MARPREFDPDQIRQRALEAFWRDGYEATSLANLEEATGLGRRSLYNSFGDKLTLFIQSLADFRTMAASTYLAPIQQPGAGLAEIETTLRLLAADGQTSSGRKGCLICNTAREPVAQIPEVNQQIQLYFQQIKQAFARALIQAREQGDIASTENVESLTQFLFGTLVSICVLAQAGEEGDVLNAMATEALNRLR
ncbi:MAG: TetR/AcrR family transcriptional regulator [Synechococcaceae cyanobacterium SM2_3_1]|nr:TetR/AcrR family transcriptional regulator [Synechococcaceae cyanobacterium SM2_3_1]